MGRKNRLAHFAGDDGEHEGDAGKPRWHAPRLVFGVEFEHGKRLPLRHLIFAEGLNRKAGCEGVLMIAVPSVRIISVKNSLLSANF